jgi:hypothetical protein
MAEILGQFDFWRSMTAGALSMLYSQFIDKLPVLVYPQVAIMQAGVTAISIFVAQRAYALVNQLVLSGLSGSLAGKAQEYFMEPIFAGVFHNYIAPAMGTSRGPYTNFMRAAVLDFGAQQFEVTFQGLFNAGVTAKATEGASNYMVL